MTKLISEIGEITDILSQWNEARDLCFEGLFPKVYDRLRVLAKGARKRMGRSNPEETLSTTSLVNEAYFHLRKTSSLTFKHRGEFFALCVVIMRRILVDYYVRRISKRRTEPLAEEIEPSTADFISLPFLSGSAQSQFSPLDLVLIVDELLSNLAAKHPRKAETLTLKFFFGATDIEIAECLELSERSVRRDCTVGEVILRRELETKLDGNDDSEQFFSNLKTRSEQLQGGKSRRDLSELEEILHRHLKDG